MPSAKDPNSTVQPGSGRLPANTVPAGALIFPAGGGSGAALEAHITDPIDAHDSTAISTPAFTGTTWSFGAADVAAAIQEVFDATNTRAVWVLDSTPGADADFDGPSALIDAYAALTADNRPTLFLQPGTYDWDDATQLERVKIIGTGTVTIQNLAGDIRLRNNVWLEAVTVSASGSFDVGPATFTLGYNKLKQVTVSATAVNVVTVFNIIENLSVGGGLVTFTGGFNFVTDLAGQVQIDAGADSISFSKVTLDVQDVSVPALRVQANDVRVEQILLDGSFLSNSPETDCIVIEGEHNHLSQVRGNAVPAFGSGNRMFVMAGNHCTVEDLAFTNLSGYSEQILHVESTTVANHLSNVSFDSISNHDAVLADIEGTNTTVSGLYANGVSGGTNFQFLKPSVVNGRISEVQLTSLTSGVGFTLPLIGIDGHDNSQLVNVRLDSIGTGGALPVNVLAFSGSTARTDIENLELNNVEASTSYIRVDGNTAKNVSFDKVVTQGLSTSGAVLHITGVTEDLDSVLTFRDCQFYGPTNSITNTIIVSSVGSSVYMENVYASSVASNASYVLSSSVCRDARYVGCTFEAANGRSALNANSAGMFHDCEFIGGSGSPGAGTQLVRGQGHDGTSYEVAPFATTACKMIYGSSNCDAASGTGSGEPVIFLGGSGGTATTPQHGPIVVRGLYIAPGSSVTAQHLDSLLVVDTYYSDLIAAPSSLEDITIDLKEITWSASGVGRGIFGNAAVVEILGETNTFSGRPVSRVQNLNILNVVENSFGADARHLVVGNGVVLDRLVVEGPGSTTHGTGSFSVDGISLSGSWATDISFGKNESLVYSAGSFVGIASTKLLRGYIRGSESTSAPVNYLDVNAGFGTLIDGLYVRHDDGALSGAIVNFSADRGIFRNCEIETVPVISNTILLIDNSDFCSITNNRINGGGENAAADAIGIAVINSDFNHVTGNHVFQVGSAFAGTTGTIYVDQNSQGNDISGNLVRTDVDLNSALWHAVFVDSDLNTVSHNRLISLGTESPRITVGANGSHNTIGNNVLWASHTTTTPFIFTSASGGNNTIVGNLLINAGSGTPSVGSHGTDEVGTASSTAPGVNKIA